MTSSIRSSPPGARDVLAQVILPTLHRQRWSLDGAASGALGRVIHLSAGRGELAHADGELALRAPDVAWLPGGVGRSLRVEPGSTGIVVGISESLLAAAIGQHADSGPLRQLTGRLCRLSAHEAGPRAELERSLLAIDTEAGRAAGGSWHYLAAQLTIVLVLMGRLAGSALPAPVAGQGAARLQRFRHLVEAQLREHWPIARYASELSMSPDRLHDLCVRTLGRTPTALVHERVAHEACLLLSGSDLSVERVAADLGFHSASHFSRFFKRWRAVGPKAWREQARQRARAGQGGLPQSYADWP